MPININIEGPETKRRRLLEEQERDLRIASLRQQIAQSTPGYAQEQAARIGRSLEESERNLQLQEELIGDVAQRRLNVAEAAEPLPAGVSGPVMPEEAARFETNRLLTAEDQLMLDAAAFRAQRESLRKDLEQLTGTRPLPTGGTYAAGETSTLRRSFEDTAKLIRDYNDRRKRAQTPEELESIDAAYAMYEPIVKQQQKKDLETARSVPGLMGTGKDEKASQDMRLRTSDFVASVQSVDDLINMDVSEFGKNPDERLRQRRKADSLRAGLIGNLRIALAGPGQLSDYERRVLESAIANPASLNPYDARYSKDGLRELKKTLARKFAADASVNGYRVKSFQDVVDANSGPAEDLETFASTKKKSEMSPQEKAFRDAGYKDGDIVTDPITGKKFRLEP